MIRLDQPAHLEHDRRSESRRETDRRNDNFLVRLILTAAVVFLIGIFAGVQMEKRNAENLSQYSGSHHSSLITHNSPTQEAK